MVIVAGFLARFVGLRICWFLKSWEEFSYDWLGSLFSSIDWFVVFALAAGFAKRASKRESPKGKIRLCLAVYNGRRQVFVCKPYIKDPPRVIN